MSKESYVYQKNCRPSTLGSVTFAQNKSTFARPKNFKTLVFIMPKDSTKQLYKGNFWYFLTTKIHFLMAFLHLELLLSLNLYLFLKSQNTLSIKITSPCINEHPYTPLLYSKTRVYRGIHYFLIFALKHRLWILVRTASLRRF